MLSVSRPKQAHPFQGAPFSFDYPIAVCNLICAIPRIDHYTVHRARQVSVDTYQKLAPGMPFCYLSHKLTVAIYRLHAEYILKQLMIAAHAKLVALILFCNQCKQIFRGNVLDIKCCAYCSAHAVFLVKHYKIEVMDESGNWQTKIEIHDNHQRFVKHMLNVTTKAVRLLPLSTYHSERKTEDYGSSTARIFNFELL
jgi:hypothetical protein